MDIRDILAQLDAIDLHEAEDSDIAAQQQLNKEKIDYVKKQEHLYSLLKQLRELVGTSQMEESKISISKELVESFGYSYIREEDAPITGDAGDKWSTSAVGKFLKTQSTSEVVKGIPKIRAVFEILQTLGRIQDELKANPKSMSYGELSKKITLIITNAVTEVGLFWLGSGLAAFALSGFAFTGIGVLIPVLGSVILGSVVELQFGNDIKKLIKAVVDKIWESASELAGDDSNIEVIPLGPTPSTTTDQGTKEKSPNYDPEVAKIQQALVAKGAKITVDGVLGPATYKAFDQYGDSLEEALSVSESIRYLQNRLSLIENDPNEVNNFYDEYAFNEEANEESGKKKFIAKFPELAKRHGVTVTPLDPAAPSTPVTPSAPEKPAEPVAPTTTPAEPTAPTITTGGSPKTLEPKTTVSKPAAAAKPSAVPATSTGVGVAPFAKLDANTRLDAMSLVKQIKLAIQDMQKVPPSVQGDARKAIDHAQQTLKTYAPDIA